MSHRELVVPLGDQKRRAEEHDLELGWQVLLAQPQHQGIRRESDRDALLPYHSLVLSGCGENVDW